MHGDSFARTANERKTKIDKPYAALEHDLAADPRLSPTDVRVLLSLLYYARGDAQCWPSDAAIGKRVGRSIGTVQRSLRRLEAFELIERQPAANPVGRLLVLRWRATPTSPALEPPTSSARDELRRQGEKERPTSEVPGKGAPPPAGDEDDLALALEWSASPDPVLRRLGGRMLAEMGPVGVVAVPGAEESSEVSTVPCPTPAEAPSVDVMGASKVKERAEPHARSRPHGSRPRGVPPSARRQGQRLVERLADSLGVPGRLEIRVSPSQR